MGLAVTLLSRILFGAAQGLIGGRVNTDAGALVMVGVLLAAGTASVVFRNFIHALGVNMWRWKGNEDARSDNSRGIAIRSIIPFVVFAGMAMFILFNEDFFE